MGTAQAGYSYAVGLRESIWASLAVAGVLVAVTILALWEPWFSRRLSYLSWLCTCLLLAGAMGFGTFCVAYPLLNQLLQLEKLLDSSTSFNAFIAYESGSGLLLLRLSSIAMGYGLFAAIVRILRSPERTLRQPILHLRRLSPLLLRQPILPLRRLNPLLTRSRRLPRYVFSDQGVEFSAKLTQRDELGIGLQNLSQYGVFMVVLANLWFLTIDEIHAWPVLVLNWALFFIVDDWVLINDYSYALRGLVYPSAAWRIHVFNMLLSALTVYVVIQEFSGWRVVTILSFLAISLVTRYVTSHYVTSRFAARKEDEDRAEEKAPVR